jgi:hypothetical protein
MANQRKVSVVDTPEAADKLEYDDIASFTMSDDGTVEVQVGDDSDFDDDQAQSVEDLDDDELIWDGGPTAGMIKAWKQQYEDVYVTSITFDKHVVWRVLSRLEYKQIVKKMEQLIQGGQLSSAEANMWNEEAIAELCILYPKLDGGSLSGAMAGLPSLISQEVLEASGFVALEVRQL